MNHLALWAASAQQVRDLPDQLRERGVALLYEDRPAGAIGTPSEWSVFFEGPDRIKVEIISPD